MGLRGDAPVRHSKALRSNPGRDDGRDPVRLSLKSRLIHTGLQPGAETDAQQKTVSTVFSVFRQETVKTVS
jgi:hypothetical protein